MGVETRILSKQAKGAKAKIWLEVKDISRTIGNNEKSCVIEKAKEQLGGVTDVMYIDFSLYKKVGDNGWRQKIENKLGNVTITVTIPESFRSKDGTEPTYYIVRVHDGRADLIAGNYNEQTYRLTFSTDRISAYAIVYYENAAAQTGYTITFDANSGSVSPARAKTTGGELASLPTPARSGYKFNGWWTQKSGGAKITADTVYASDTTIYAHWRKRRGPAPTTYTVNVDADPAGSGTATGGGTYSGNTSVTVTASASAGCRFVRWTENGEEVSTSEGYTFTVTGSRSLVAVFEADTKLSAEYTVSFDASTIRSAVFY